MLIAAAPTEACSFTLNDNRTGLMKKELGTAGSLFVQPHARNRPKTVHTGGQQGKARQSPSRCAIEALGRKGYNAPRQLRELGLSS